MLSDQVRRREFAYSPITKHPGYGTNRMRTGLVDFAKYPASRERHAARVRNDQ